MASSSKRYKRVAQKVRSASLSGRISDEVAQTNFECFWCNPPSNIWRIRKVISHKLLGILFFIREGFVFQDWLEYQGLARFVEMLGDWYLDLVKVFYANLKVENGIICSKVKGVNIKLDEAIWSTIVGFKPGGHKSYMGVFSINKLVIYKACLRNPDKSRNFTCLK